MHPVRIGCSGWSYRDWRERFYPPGTPSSRWLEHYSSVFDTVELNATFYRLPPIAATRKWAEGTPDGFLFAAKASRYLTHMRRLRDMQSGLARFWERLEPLREAGKLGPVLWQLPENFHRDDEVLAGALQSLPGDARHCFEFRHPSWFATSPVGPLAYLRLHYGARGRKGNYSERELETWRRRIAAWRSRRTVFVYLNNDWQGFAPRNALYLGRGLS